MVSKMKARRGFSKGSEKQWEGCFSSQQQVCRTSRSYFFKIVSLTTCLQSGLWGLAGYPLSGILREINDSLGKHQKCMIAMGRISQGLEEFRESTAQDRAEVSTTWSQIEHNLKRSDYGHTLAD